MEINFGYILNELRKALEAKNESKSAESAEQAAKRIAQWCDVLSGTQSGGLRIGSRKPTEYPTWVTLEVARGGFATGRAAADVVFAEDERNLLAVLSPLAPRFRDALFSALLSPNGLAWLKELLASRRYKIERPEDAALLAAAWLHENGRLEDAAFIIDEISRYASVLRFMPKTAREPLQKTELAHRFSSGDARGRLLKYRENLRIETQREALKVWIPFMDRLVSHWLELFGGGQGGQKPSEEWKNAAAALVSEHESLRKKYTLCAKYHNKKENLQILLAATRDFLSLSDSPSGANLSRARHVVECYVKAHGRTGEDRFTALRREQARVASLPSHAAIARAVAEKLPDSEGGLTNVEGLTAPIGSIPVPKRICKILRGAMSASVPELIESGIVPSAEVMAELTPQLTALEIGRAYADENLGLLVAETYKAFCRRRSLLLVDLSSQVRFDELPWIKAVKGLRLNTECHAAAALRLAGYAIGYFPGTILPNPLIEQLNALYELAGRKLPFTAELAADIFMGRFAQKFDCAALAAARLLRGSLYERYYGLDCAKFEERFSESGRGGKTPLERTVEEHMNKYGANSQNFVVRNGMMIERAQIYTTHNLATLVAENVKPGRPYEELAFMAFEHSLNLVKRGRTARKIYGGYLRFIKNAAYAWRQALFFLSVAPSEAVSASIRRAEESSLRLLGERVTRGLFERLEAAAGGERPDETSRFFLGWTSGPHWLVNL